MKDGNNNVLTFVATQKSPIAAEDETKATDQPFSNVQSAFIRPEMMTLEFSLVLRARIYTHGSRANMLLGRPE